MHVCQSVHAAAGRSWRGDSSQKVIYVSWNPALEVIGHFCNTDNTRFYLLKESVSANDWTVWKYDCAEYRELDSSKASCYVTIKFGCCPSAKDRKSKSGDSWEIIDMECTNKTQIHVVSQIFNPETGAKKVHWTLCHQWRHPVDETQRDKGLHGN